MKLFYSSIILLLAILLNPGCKGGGKSQQATENTSSTDTGFTGVKHIMSGNHLVMEASYKNGIKEGLSKTFYPSGKLRGTTWYENGLMQDSAKWYFEEGQLFRSTPVKNDTVEGTQKVYYRNGRVKALIGYRKGLRTFEFQEFDLDGKKFSTYPDLIVNKKDNYSSNGTYTLSLSLSDNKAKVKFFRGDFSNGLFDSTKCERIKNINGIGTLDLKKAGSPQKGSVDVLASILTPLGNNYLVHKKIELPYKDIN